MLKKFSKTEKSWIFTTGPIRLYDGGNFHNYDPVFYEFGNSSPGRDGGEPHGDSQRLLGLCQFDCNRHTGYPFHPYWAPWRITKEGRRGIFNFFLFTGVVFTAVLAFVPSHLWMGLWLFLSLPR